MTDSDLHNDFEPPLPPKLAEALRYRPHRRSSADSPAVDREILLKLVRKELSKDLVKSAYRLIQTFENWKQAFEEIIVEEFPNRQAQDAPSPPRDPDAQDS